MICFDKTIIPLALVRYEMIIANLALRASLATYHQVTTKLASETEFGDLNGP